MGQVQYTVTSNNNPGLSIILGNRNILDGEVREQKPDASSMSSRALVKQGSLTVQR